MVIKIFVSCSKGKKSWFFEEKSTISDIIENTIKDFKYDEKGSYELWQSYKEEQIVLDLNMKIKDLKIKDEEVLHFIDLSQFN